MAQACAQSKSVFAIAPYEPDDTGVLRVVLPKRCVFAAASETCCVFVDHYRDRKTGPCFPLAVVGCSCHAFGRYTLYPPGHVPYGRQAVVRCSLSGPLLRDRARGQAVWQATLFGAATDVADGQRWPADSPADDERRRRTQGGRLELAGQLLGVHLRVPTMTLRTAAGQWTTSWMTRGAAVLAVLRALLVDDSLLDRILAAGAVTDLWPPHQRWDPVRRKWVRCRSRRRKRPVASAPQSRAPPPTNSPAAV